jgi:predicted nucleic acid-binding protein
MKVVFADTGYWVAVLDPQDDLNAKARATSSNLGKTRILTTEMVLDELLAALSGVPERGFAIRGVDAMRTDPNVEVVAQTSIQFREAFDL